MTRSDPTALHQLLRTGTRQGGGKRAFPFPAGLSGSWVCELCRYNQPAFRRRGAKYRCHEDVRGLGRHVCLHSKCSAGRPLSANTARRSISVGQPFHNACVIGEQPLDVHAEVQYHWDSHLESNSEIDGEIWNGRGADGRLVVHPVTSEWFPGRIVVVVLAPEWQQNQTVYALMDEGLLLDSSGNSLAGLGNRDTDVVVAEQIPSGPQKGQANIIPF